MKKEERKGGAYRQMLLAEQRQEHKNITVEKAEDVSFFRIKFYICLCLLVAYAILDYTGATFYQFDSKMILSELQKNIELDFDVDELVTEVVSAWSEQSI